jgi:hypothetical protein
MLALESCNAAADAESFRAAGVGGFDLLRFERTGRKADGSLVTVGFSLAFAVDPRLGMRVSSSASSTTRRIFGTRCYKSTPTGSQPSRGGVGC